jgi:hypothetical protein
MMMRRCEEANFFFASYFTFACCLFNVRLRSSSLRKSIVERKKMIEDMHKGESEGAKENDFVNTSTVGILTPVLWIWMLLLDQGAPLHMVASGLLKLRRSSLAIGLPISRTQ